MHFDVYTNFHLMKKQNKQEAALNLTEGVFGAVSVCKGLCHKNRTVSGFVKRVSKSKIFFCTSSFASAPSNEHKHSLSSLDAKKTAWKLCLN